MMLMEEVDCRESCITVYIIQDLQPSIFMKIIDCRPQWLTRY